LTVTWWRSSGPVASDAYLAHLSRVVHRQHLGAEHVHVAEGQDVLYNNGVLLNVRGRAQLRASTGASPYQLRMAEDIISLWDRTIDVAVVTVVWMYTVRHLEFFSTDPKGIYNARCLGEMLRLINRFLVKHWCLYRLDRCLTKHLFYTNKHQCLAKYLVYFSKHLL
jgi:hypothetical protein